MSDIRREYEDACVRIFSERARRVMDVQVARLLDAVQTNSVSARGDTGNKAMKNTNQKQPARGKWAGMMEDKAFRKRADKRHAANKAARAARKAGRGR